MTLDELWGRALEIREQFAQFEKQQGSQAWGAREIMDGFVGDVGDLMKLVMARHNLRKIDDLDAKIAHELADCLWSVLVLADKLDVDIEKAFTHTMDDIEKKLTARMP
jgi:NTP pyrophosphatase (non-canonical NTP hydrolase)